MSGAKGFVSEEQFFKELDFVLAMIFSYFPNGEYKLGVDLLLDVDGTIQRLRDEVVWISFLSVMQIESFNNLNGMLQRIKTKKRIASAIQELSEK